MLLKTMKGILKSGLVASVMTGAVFLLSAENAFAVANLTLSTGFSSADPARANASMDSAGTWDGAIEVTNTVGDQFTLSVQNTATGEVNLDSAFDLSISVNVPASFRLPQSPMTVTAVVTVGSCSNFNLSATQSGGAGSQIDFNIPSNTSIAPACSYDFNLGLTSDDSAPFAAAGLQSVVFNLSYNAQDNDVGSQQNVSNTENIQLNPGNVALTKTALTAIAANGQNVDFRVDLLSADSGGIFDVVFTDTLSANLTSLTFTSLSAFDNATNNPVPVPPNTAGPLFNQITFDYIPSNVRIEIGLSSVATVNPTAIICPDMTNDGSAIERTGISASDFATTDFNLANSLQLSHNLSSSFCELCGVGTIRLTVQNVGGVSLVNINLVEDLLASGLTYVANSTQISIDGAAPVAAGNPIVSGASSQILNWTPAQISQLGQLDSPFASSPPNPISIEFIFQVQRAPGFNEEGLASAIRNIQPSATYDLICGGISQNTSGALVELPIRQPVPQVTKLGRNLDAAQAAGGYANIVYGHIEDSIIWRVEVQNQNIGQGDLEDLLMDDTIGGNFDINWLCVSEATATAAAASTNGSAPSGCVSAGGGVRTSVLNFAIDDPFGNPGNDENATFVDVSVASSGFIYYVGRIQASCTNQTNSVDIEWGCEADSPPDGGLTTPASSNGIIPSFGILSQADMSTQVITNGVTIAQAVTGINVAQPVGSSGLVTITLTNLSGATIRNLDLTDTLPVEYVVDYSFVPTAVVTPFYGTNYLGMVDTISWDNQDVANPLNNTAPHFVLTSSTSRSVSTIAGDDVNLLRHGDVLTIQFRIVVIDVTRYDLVADLDVIPEVQADGTDPDSDFTINNNVHINFDNICGQSGLTVADSNENFAADIEDLDVNTSDALFILTNNPGTPLDLSTLVTNNGGHDASNYTVYITFGQAMTVQTVPAGCAITTNPPPHPHWKQPAPIPTSAFVYACNRPPIAAGTTDTIIFSVIKAGSAAVDDDLTFRADVVGEVTLSDGTALTFPAPASIANTTPNLQLANNYSLDAVRARVMGFNLTKSVWYCSESGAVEPAPSVPPPPTPAELNTQIGEDCNYFIESGGWFGFLTPGFTLIAVENVVVTDDLPNGQGFIAFGGSAYNFNNTANITLTGVNGGAGITPLIETDIVWNFNATGNGIVIKDEFFRVDFKTRLLNDPVDLSYPVPGGYTPNLHANTSLNTARTSFDAIFNSALGNVTINVSDGAGIPGYPVPAVRQVSLTEIEPNLIVSKAVCNETLSINAGNGSGANCNSGNFSNSIDATDADAGDTNDEYVYRVIITNQASSGGVTRAPAFNVSITDVLDVSDLMLIAPGGAVPFDNDGLDNDGDGFTDALDLDGEFFSLTENVADGVAAATFVISHEHSNALEQINPGQDVTFYYRIDPDQNVAPLQTLSNNIATTYDSLAGDFGNQNTPQLLNSENTAPNNSGRARLYTAIATGTSIQMLPLLTTPKQILQLSNTVVAGTPQNVAVGEEILYELYAQIPVARLSNFTIRDELPPGLRCVDAQTVDLNAAPYSAAQFRTNGALNVGTFAASCDPTGASNIVQWSFGDQELTAGTPGALFDFRVRFIARVENTTTTIEGCNIRNGGSASGTPTACSTNPSVARLTYIDEASSTITLTYGAVDVLVREPVINITKSFAPVTQADADDTLDVTVSITNTGDTTNNTASAYNLQVLDDLTGSNMTFLNVVGGTDPPDNIDIATLGANQPIFSWDSANPDFAIAPTEVKTFTFRVQLDNVVQPHEVLDNTIEARWTSLPDNVAINDIDNGGARIIAADGDALGMRNGQLSGVSPASANPPNDYNDTATAFVLVPELTIAKNDIDPSTDLLIEAVPTIGEHKKFQLVIDIPEGITNNVIVVDDLDARGAAGESYVIENDATYDITYSFPGISTINGDAPSEAAFVAGIANATDGFPIDESSGVVTWTIGTVDTASEDDNDVNPNTVNPQIIITYYARINNDVNTDVGDDLQNAANLSYINGEDSSTENWADDTPLITVLEPNLTVTKTVSNITSAGNGPDGGDILEYIITINNVGNATAFDTNIIDNLPTGLLRDASFTPTATGGSYLSFEALPLNTPNSPLIWGRANTTTLPGGDESLDILAGGRLILTYRTVVQDVVEPNQVLTNTVVVDWTSLDGVNSLERFGTGGVDCSATVAPNDYCISNTSTTSVPNLINITKTYNNDTFAPLTDGNLRIGDVVQYTINLELQEGTLRGDATNFITLVDTIPNGMEFLQVVSVNGDAAAPYSSAGVFTYADILAPVVTTGAGSNTITWTLGNASGITNAADNNPANDDFIIVYQAQVVNDELAMPQNTSTALLNTANLNFVDVNNVANIAVDTESITALEPQIVLSDISKVRRNGILSGSPVTVGASTGTGDIMDFELQACNSGLAPAYDLIIEDVLSVEMNETSIRSPGDLPTAGTPPVVTINGAAAAAGVEYVYSAPAGPAGTMRFTFNDINTPLLPGQCVVVQFDIDNQNVGANLSWDNSFQVVEYHSLHTADVNTAEREDYVTLVGPILFNMNTVTPIYPPSKTLLSPLAPAEATIGQLVTYQVLVPNVAMTPTLFDLTLTDTMSSSLTYVSSAVDTTASNAYTGTISDAGSISNQVNIVLDNDLFGGQQATITIVARINNDAITNITTTPFANTVNYTFAGSSGGSPIIGGGDQTDLLNNISIIEPNLQLQSKTVINTTQPGNPPDAGDILRYTLSINASGGAQFSDAFDVSIIDSLSLGLVYSGNSTISAGVGSISNPGIVNNGISAPQVMSWNLANGSNIDIPEGTAGITITYEVLVLDSVLANQALTNSAVIQWTSLNGVDLNERNGSGGVNNYISGPQTTSLTTPDNNAVSKVRLSDTSPVLNAANDVRIGDIVDYQISLSLQEGTSNTVVLSDTLPQGLQFEGIVSINADTSSPYVNVAPFSHSDILTANVVAAGNPLTGPSTVTWNLGNITNAGANNGNNNFVIIYRARVLNLVQTPLNNPSSNIALLNTLNFNYAIATGAATTETDNETITIQQPNLTLTKNVATQIGDLILEAGEQITYTVDIINGGQSPAYDVRLEDVIPSGIRQGGVTVISIEVPIGKAVANLAPVYNAATGQAVWDFDTGVANAYTIPAGQSLRIVYQVMADAGIGAGLSNLINTANVPLYYSFDDEAAPSNGAVNGVREIYGPSNTASASGLSTPAPSPLSKVNPGSLNQSIGIPFTYRITVPNSPESTALYDVRILDNLDNLAPNVDLIFVAVQKISVNGAWVPVNSGTPTNLIISDAINGIDIPAGEQAVIDLTLVLRNSSNNVDGDSFINQASYTFNSVDGDNTSQGIGGPDTDVALTIVEPLAMTLQKSGPALMTFGTAGTFTLNVQNISSGPASDLTITDMLPNPPAGGMCDVAPTNFSARVFQADGVTAVSIAFIENTHFTTTFVGAPTCTVSITMTSALAEIVPLNRLIVTYDALLDLDNINNAALDNVAASTQWFSGDTPAGVVVGEIRPYTEVISSATPGTPGTLDHEDVFTTSVAAPQLVIVKNVFNPLTGAPAFTAEPGENVRYEISVTNIGPVAAMNFNLTDEPDRLNGGGFFVPGSMNNIVVSQTTADQSNTDINAGVNGAGILDIRNLTLTDIGGGNNALNISFEMTLQAVIDSGTLVRNQAEVALLGFSSLPSDDPNLPGAVDPTQTIIGSIPTFRLLKTSVDVSGSVTVLQAGDILRYTISAQNIGAENSINTLLRDQIPANTSYVANTTTLNGVAISDPSAGISPLQNGILINAAEDVTAGAMRANSTATGNIASINFDVLINENVVNSTVISNQAFVGGDGVGSGPFSEQPSDDPNTDIIGDPTRDVVGNVAIVDMQNTVELVVDNGVTGQVDANDTLRYTITISNSGTIAANNVQLFDNVDIGVTPLVNGVPVNTSYVVNSSSLNSITLVDNGLSSPLTYAAGIDISSSDLAPPVQGSGMGSISPGASAILIYDVTVNAGTAVGSIISNQLEVISAEFPDEFSDEDGNDINGDQPTQTIVGNTQQLSISKNVFVVGGGVAQPGGMLEYFINVENSGSRAIDLSSLSAEVLKIFDDIDQANLITYVPGSARLNGVADPNIVFNAPRLIVNYDLTKRALSPKFMFESGDKFSVRYLVQIDASAEQGITISNTAAIDWGGAQISANNSTAINCSGASLNVDACSTVDLAVGGAPGVATLSGSLWHDINFDELQTTNERVLAGWEIEIYFGAGTINPGDLLDSVFSDVNGNYSIQGLVPNDGDALKYALRFRPPGASTDTASLGSVISPFFSGNGPQILNFFEVGQGSHTPSISLPIQPNGVTYDSVLRAPVAGSILQLTNSAGIALPGSCFVDPVQQDQRTVVDGYYKFELNFSQTECAVGADYIINVFPPSGYYDADNNSATPNISSIIPPALSLTEPAFDAVSCSNDPLPTVECEVQTSEFAPIVDIAPRTAATNYYQKLTFGNSAGDEQIFNNHIAIDPLLDNAISISKTSALVNVTRGQLVPYLITLSNNLSAPIYDLDLTDLFPSGFKYIAGSGRMQTDNEPWVKTEPIYSEGLAAIPLTSVNQYIDLNDVTGVEDINEFVDIARVLSWNNIDILRPNSTISLKLLLVVGSGVGEGEYINRAIATNNQTAGAASGIASATVRVIPDPTFDCSDVIGKVFDDKNLNAYQDEGEEGIAGIRVLTARGLEITTDAHGRFHLTCAVVPNPDRGSNFIIKLDERSLPSGYRLTTENPRVVRATRGKMIKFNFGAAIHRVVRLDMADAVFEPKTTKMRPQWLPRLDILITELAKDPSLLRLSYLADNETPDEVDDRLNAVKDEIEKRWQELNCCYQLSIETEVFWRKGGPVNRREFNE